MPKVLNVKDSCFSACKEKIRQCFVLRTALINTNTNFAFSVLLLASLEGPLFYKSRGHCSPDLLGYFLAWNLRFPLPTYFSIIALAVPLPGKTGSVMILLAFLWFTKKPTVILLPTTDQHTNNSMFLFRVVLLLSHLSSELSLWNLRTQNCFAALTG